MQQMVGALQSGHQSGSAIVVEAYLGTLKAQAGDLIGHLSAA